ncbi:MAG TPA: DNA replication/repair protein RecF [Gammaproteobacteria bacterium]|nr:DNA replication/repair protein RecF [Gammaproteobacteria bacterium]
MALLRLDITDFRNLGSASIYPMAEGFNFFHGRNGSGKTSLLEAIYYLGRGRSFRSALVNHVISQGAEKFSIFAEIQAENQQTVPVGVLRERDGGTRIRISGHDSASSAALLELTPCLLINSGCFNLLDAGPHFRRKYLDWGAFYLNQDFLPAWKLYERVLRQRNAALRERKSRKEVAVWSAELVKSATVLDALRREGIAQLLPFLQTVLSSLIELPALKLVYYPGWDEALTYEEAMNRSNDKDIVAGYTQMGPHRADFRMTIDRVPVKDILSRGQQKLFICAMIIAQGAMLQECVNRRPVYLIDDLPSELDIHSRSYLMALLARQKAQVFVTAVEREALVGVCQAQMKMFHVKHGCVKEENPGVLAVAGTP